IGLRNTAIRVLTRQNTLLTCRTRSFHSVIPSSTRLPIQRSSAFQLQRRFASSGEEAQTQSEPVADGAEAQHGDNSIAASSNNSTGNGEPLREGEEGRVAAQQEGGHEHSTVGEMAESAADKVKETASDAFEAIAGGGGAASASSSSRGGLNRGAYGGGATRANDAEPTASVYVGNLFFDVREDDLRKKFEGCGTIENAKLIMDNRGLSKG
ncbi:MAG: hypothetical protein Q9169_008695, partial [Polycauliona sp. 2 TL-2023]